MAFPPDPRPPNARGARRSDRAEPFDVFVRRVCPDFAHVILAENERLREALKAIAAADDLVAANEDAFSVHAFRRCQQIADAALAPNSEERP